MNDRTGKDGMVVITAALEGAVEDGCGIELWVERRTLAKRLWRGTAADGTEFGFDLERRLAPGAVFYRSGQDEYVIRQHPERCLEIRFGDLPASAVAGIAWAVGNLHLEFSADAQRMVTPDEPEARRLLERIGIGYQECVWVFRPGHFKRHAAVVQELGESHRHV